MTKEFIRRREVDIKQYLPHFIFKDDTLKAVADSQSREHEELRLYLIDLLLQSNVSTATWGLKLWEKDLQLIPKDGDSYEIRRARIWDKLQTHNISTLEYITRVINRYADDRATVEEANEDYKIFITIDDGAITDWEALLDSLTTWLPAHIAYDFIVETVLSGGFFFGGVVTEYDKIHIISDEGGNE